MPEISIIYNRHEIPCKFWSSILDTLNVILDKETEYRITLVIKWVGVKTTKKFLSTIMYQAIGPFQSTCQLPLLYSNNFGCGFQM